MPELAAPSALYRHSFDEALKEYSPDETDMSYERDFASTDFDDYVRRAAAWSRGEDLPEGWTPHSHFWLVDGNEYLGSCHIAHTLDGFIYAEGGHIGYIIRPSQRRKGYGTLICRLALDEARKLGLDRVLLTCANTNVGSVKIIERDCGVLQDKIMVGTRPVPTRRYWIEL